MRNTFREYFYEPDESLLKTAVIVLDTNVLLDLFRMSLKSREELLDILGHEDVQGRLWMPHQVGAEFFRNKDDVVHKFQKDVEALKSRFKEKFQELAKIRQERHKSDKEKDVKGRSRLDLDEIESLIQTAQSKVDSVLLKALKAIRDSGDDADVLDALVELYDGRVAPAPTEAERNEAVRTAQQRFLEGNPPGNLDLYKASGTNSLKDGKAPASNLGNPYGDYFIWRELLAHAKQAKQPIVFVTGDMKGDWWHKVGNELKGPRKELIREFLDVTGQDIEFHTPGHFYKQTASLLEAELADETKAELQSIEKQHAERNKAVRWSSLFDGLNAYNLGFLEPITLANNSVLQQSMGLAGALDTAGMRQAMDEVRKQAGFYEPTEFQQAIQDAQRLTKGYSLAEIQPLIDEHWRAESILQQYRAAAGFLDEVPSDDEDTENGDDSGQD